jgi:cyanophycinase
MAQMFAGEKYSPKGKLIIIGGHEDKGKLSPKTILKEVVKQIGSGKLVVTTVASKVGEEVWRDYKKVFTSLGVKKLAHLSIDSREEAFRKRAITTLKGAKGLFFTGGDQLAITSEIGGTELCRMLHRLYLKGGIIAGTSAGASVMGTEMLVSGPSDKTAKSGNSVQMAPGLGLVKELIIDQHFAERGRISRLLAAVALNPKHLGVGIDEDTAIIFKSSSVFQVLGCGGVYVVDCTASNHSNVEDRSDEYALSVHNARVHVLNEGEQFDITKRQPIIKTGRKRRKIKI